MGKAAFPLSILLRNLLGNANSLPIQILSYCDYTTIAQISGIKLLTFLHIIPVQGTEGSIILQSTVYGSLFLFFLAQYVLFFWTAKSIIRGEHFRRQEVMLDN